MIKTECRWECPAKGCDWSHARYISLDDDLEIVGYELDKAWEACRLHVYKHVSWVNRFKARYGKWDLIIQP